MGSVELPDYLLDVRSGSGHPLTPVPTEEFLNYWSGMEATCENPTLLIDQSGIHITLIQHAFIFVYLILVLHTPRLGSSETGAG